MRSSNVVIAALLLIGCGLPRESLAQCMICDELITINDKRAKCFKDNFKLISEMIESAKFGRKIFNLDSCVNGDGELSFRGDGGISELPKLPDPSGQTGKLPTTKSAYMLDANGANCLEQLIGRHKGSFDPFVTFDLFEQCPR